MVSKIVTTAGKYKVRKNQWYLNINGNTFVLPFIFFLIHSYKKGFNMIRFKKILYFILGFFLVPATLGMVSCWILGLANCEIYVSYWGNVYLFTYLLFPFIRKIKIFQKISNKYVIYAVCYLFMAIPFFWWFL